MKNIGCCFKRGIMLITENDRRKICDLAQSVCEDKNIIEKMGELDYNKVCYLLEVIILNDIEINSDNLLACAIELYGNEECVIND